MKEDIQLIAKFMGRSWEDILNICTDELYDAGHRDYDYVHNILNWKCYHSSWDWLMTVVDKIDMIEGIKLSITDRGSIKIFGTGDNNYPTYAFVDIRGNGRFNTTYKAVIEFINWYNANGKK